MPENQKVTSVEDFYKREDVFKVVTLPSGLTLKLRKIHSHACLGKDKPNFLRNARDIAKPNTDNPSGIKEYTEEEKNRLIEINNDLICDAVVEPGVSLTRVEGKIFISDINDDDYNALIKEITSYSLPQRAALKPFRAEPISKDN